MTKSPFLDGIISLVVAIGVLLGASWVLRTVNGTANDPVAGMQDVACRLIVEVTGWHPAFPCWWVLVGALLAVWLLIFGAARAK